MRLYTGNDDNIVLDLVTPFVVPAAETAVRCGSRAAFSATGAFGLRAPSTVRAHQPRCRRRPSRRRHAGARRQGHRLQCGVSSTSPITSVAALQAVTKCLRRQGLFEGIWCLDPTEVLSQGQAEAIERVMRLYPELGDDAFVAANRERWLS